VKLQLKWLSEQLEPGRDMDVFVKEIVIPLQQSQAPVRGSKLATLEAVLKAGRAAGVEKAQAGYERALSQNSSGDAALARRRRMEAGSRPAAPGGAAAKSQRLFQRRIDVAPQENHPEDQETRSRRYKTAPQAQNCRKNFATPRSSWK
jgi:hypothetical protein